MNISNQRIINYLNDNNLTIVESDPKRPWGGWYLIDINKSTYSDRKILHVIPHTLLSLQYHGTPLHLGHMETWNACTKIRAVVSKISVVYQTETELNESLKNLAIIDIYPGGTLIIGSGFIHALANPFLQDIYVIETRQSQIAEMANDRENNIVRIYDQTNRNGTPSYPNWLVQKIMDPTNKPDYEVKEGNVFDIRTDFI